MKPSCNIMRALGRISPRNSSSNAGILAAAVLVLSALTQQVPSARCDTKEFDWSDLNVSLASPRTSLGAGGSSSSSSSAAAANNLRILVSPQRRMTKNYEFEYNTGNTTNSQPLSADSGSYVMQAGLPGTSYLAQSALAPNHSGHSSAYSALSASLASLKSRLSARGVSLSSSLADTGAGQPAGLYSNSATYATSLSADPSQQQQPTSSGSALVSASVGSPSAAQQMVGQAHQPTYLSVSAAQQQQEAQAASAYTVPPSSQDNHNKTIVLAIPAKINFLTGSKQQQQQQQHQQQVQQQQQPPQVTVIQSDGQQQTRPEYGAKQLVGLINGQEVVDQSGHLLASPIEGQDHHQYVIVNSPAQSADYHSHSVAASLSPSPVTATGQQIYSSATIYQPASSSSGSYSLKYSPTGYSQQQQQQQSPQPQLTTIVHQQQQQHQPLLQPTPTIQKYYSMIEQTQPVPQQQITLASPQQPVYEQATVEQQQQQQQQHHQQVSANVRPYSLSAYAYAPSSSCPDTCNSADPRWRKYTVSKYKACCSRSTQYDSTFEQPSLDKVGEASSKYSDDAYYGYLYRKSRARRSRRQRARYNQQRYNSQQSSSAAAAASPVAPQTSSSLDDEDNRSANNNGDGFSQPEPKATKGQYQETSSSSSSLSSPSSSSSSSSSNPSSSPYMKYYTRSRYQYSAPLEQADRDVEPVAPPPPPPPAKYLASKEARSYRRGRSRELEAPLQEVQVNSNANNYNEPGDDQDSGPIPASPAVYGRSSAALSASSGGSYGGGDYSVDAGTRYGPAGDDDGGYGSDESIGSELDKSIDSDYASGEPLMEPGDDLSGPDGDQAPVYKYSSGGSRRRKQPSKNRRRQIKEGSSSRYYQPSGNGSQSKKGGRNHNNNNKANKYGKAETSQSNNNTTDYESAQAGDYGHGQSSSSSSSSADSNDEGSYSSSSSSSSQSLKNDNSNENIEAEKDAVAAAKYRASLNETAVANLSKTTMHLKEILSLLEKKAQYGLSSANNGKSANANDTNASNNNGLPVTSTPSPLLPITTTISSLYPMSSLFGSAGSSYGSVSGALPSEFLNSELSMKTPYRYEPSLSSSLGSSLSLPSSFGSLGSDSFSSALASYPTLGHHHSTYGLHSAKPLGMPSHLGPLPPHHGPPPAGPHHPRKRRVNKNSLRYNELMLHKAAHGLGMSPAFLHATAAKNRFLNQAYYQTLQHPYLYRGGSPTVTNPYPYKNIHKNPYSALFNGPVSSKLASSAAASLYSDESRGGPGGAGGLHGAGASSYDPLSNVASSLRPSTTMRLRSKPFVFQPQVLPIYSRHTILSQPLDVKA